MAMPLRVETVDPVADIIREFEAARTLPRAALAAAVEHACEIEPAVIQVVDHAANGALLTPKQANLLFFGVHTLAAARRTGLYRPLLRLMQKLPDDEVEWLLGDASTETLGPVLLALFDGDVAPLVDVAMDRSANGFARWTVWEVLARLTFDGTIERSAMLILLDRFEREGLANHDDPAWKGWQEAIILLGVEEMRERMRATWHDGRNPERLVDQAANEEALAASQAAAAGDTARFERHFLVPLGDPAEALARFEWADEAEHKASRRTQQDNDIAGMASLDPEETKWLLRFFERQYGVAEEIWEAVDGFCCGMIAGPTPAEPRDYILEAFSEKPRFDTPEQADHVISLLLRHWNAVAYRMSSGDWHDPILADSTYLPAAFWATGFLRAGSLRIEDWKHRSRDEAISLSIQSIMLLAGRDLKGWAPLNRRTRTELVDALPLILRALYDAWRGRRDPLARGSFPAVLKTKVGRNQVCPCGSGKKFKRCCGFSERLAAG